MMAVTYAIENGHSYGKNFFPWNRMRDRKL